MKVLSHSWFLVLLLTEQLTPAIAVKIMWVWPTPTLPHTPSSRYGVAVAGISEAPLLVDPSASTAMLFNSWLCLHVQTAVEEPLPTPKSHQI